MGPIRLWYLCKSDDKSSPQFVQLKVNLHLKQQMTDSERRLLIEPCSYLLTYVLKASLSTSTTVGPH